jgi:hypothetical protein
VPKSKGLKKVEGEIVNPGGQPTKYSPAVITETEKYLHECIDKVEYIGDKRPIRIIDAHLPTIEGLANRLRVHRDTLYEWAKHYKEFSDMLTHVRQLQAERLINKGLSGDYNPVISKLLLAKHGYVERTDVTTDGEALQPALVQFVSSKKEREKVEGAE